MHLLINTSAYLCLFLFSVTSVCRGYEQFVELVKFTSIEANLIAAIPTDPTDPPEYICMSSLQRNIKSTPGSNDELIVGVCTPNSQGLSGAVGTFSFDDLSAEVNVLYGDATRNRSSFLPGSDWDDNGTEAQMKSPEYLYQANDIIYFVDDNSCARTINRSSGNVATHIGTCGDGTLDLATADTFGQKLIYGMTFFEEKDMWVFAVVNLGVYVYDFTTNTGRRLIARTDMSTTVGDSVQQLLRAPPPNQNITWQKVSKGMNYYDMTEVNATSGAVRSADGNLVRFISATGQASIDSSAKHHNISYPAIGQTNADLDFSPDEKTLLIADTDLDLLFFLYVNGRGIVTEIDTVPDGEILQVTNCARNSTVDPVDDIDRCTFASISDAIWINNEQVLIYERLAGTFRIIERNYTMPVTTTSESPTTTSTSKPTTTTSLSSSDASSITSTNESTTSSAPSNTTINNAKTSTDIGSTSSASYATNSSSVTTSSSNDTAISSSGSLASSTMTNIPVKPNTLKKGAIAAIVCCTCLPLLLIIVWLITQYVAYTKNCPPKFIPCCFGDAGKDCNKHVLFLAYLGMCLCCADSHPKNKVESSDDDEASPPAPDAFSLKSSNVSASQVGATVMCDTVPNENGKSGKSKKSKTKSSATTESVDESGDKGSPKKKRKKTKKTKKSSKKRKEELPPVRAAYQRNVLTDHPTDD